VVEWNPGPLFGVKNWTDVKTYCPHGGTGYPTLRLIAVTDPTTLQPASKCACTHEVYGASLKLIKGRKASSGMLRRAALVRADVSKELSACIIRVTRISELGTTLAVTSNRRTLRRTTPSDPDDGGDNFLLRSVLTRATRRNIPEDGIILVLHVGDWASGQQADPRETFCYMSMKVASTDEDHGFRCANLMSRNLNNYIILILNTDPYIFIIIRSY
jgi:hypothetical protein